MKSIVLTEHEQRIATWLAKKRYETARASGVKDKKIGDQSYLDTDLEGIAAELAFCKYMNIYPDLSIGARSGGYDCIVNGWEIDVKATKYKTGKLLATLKKAYAPCNIYVLIVGTFPEYEIKGFAFAEDLLQKENEIDLGKGIGYALEQKDLRDINTIKLIKRYQYKFLPAYYGLSHKRSKILEGLRLIHSPIEEE